MNLKLFILLIFLSLPVLAKSDTHEGLFQVDSSHSKINMPDGDQKISGFIDIKKDFSGSRIEIESEKFSFSSQEIKGLLEHFEVRGILTYKGLSAPAVFTGRNYGLKVLALSLKNDQHNFQIVASKPHGAIQAQVQEIFE